MQATTAAAEVSTTPEAVSPTAVEVEVVMTTSKVAAAVAAGRLSVCDDPT